MCPVMSPSSRSISPDKPSEAHKRRFLGRIPTTANGTRPWREWMTDDSKPCGLSMPHHGQERDPRPRHNCRHSRRLQLAALRPERCCCRQAAVLRKRGAVLVTRENVLALAASMLDAAAKHSPPFCHVQSNPRGSLCGWDLCHHHPLLDFQVAPRVKEHHCHQGANIQPPRHQVQSPKGSTVGRVQCWNIALGPGGIHTAGFVEQRPHLARAQSLKRSCLQANSWPSFICQSIYHTAPGLFARPRGSLGKVCLPAVNGARL